MARLDFWPSPQQELLLTAALGDGEAAVRAWQNWQRDQTIETTDKGSRRILPLVYFNLERNGLSDPLMASLKETYSRTLLANKLRLAHLSRLLELFESREIPTLLLKGAALTLQVYRDAGLRPMADLDLAVPHRCATQAMELLNENGWRSEPCQSGGRVDPEFFASVQFQDIHGIQLDLHFSPFHDYTPFFRNRLAWTAVAPLWAAATPLCINGSNTLTLSATDSLLHTLEHGGVANAIPPLRWVADATWLLRGALPISWDRFIAQAATFNLSLIASRTLDYLRKTHGVEVPTAVLYRLKRNYSPVEVLEYSSRRDKLRRWIAARKCWAIYANEHPDRHTLELIVGFVYFLKTRWSARSSIDLLWAAFRNFLFVPR